MSPQAGQLLVSALSLAAVLLAILGFSHVLKRFAGARLSAGLDPAAPVLRGSLALDSRRRLHLIEAHGQAVLVLTGGATDVMVCVPAKLP